MSTPSLAVAANVRAEVARKGLSQVTIATALGLPQSGVSRRLRGKVPFSLDELSAVAALVNVPLATLLDGVPNGPTKASA
jgi:transcriptional regulator with XRE-family HTH domain